MNEAFNKLPLFATDREIAIAIVGKERATSWLKSTLPVLEAKSGFPRVDLLHNGRPVPLVKKWYSHYMMRDKN